jgi:hypothetical protein
LVTRPARRWISPTGRTSGQLPPRHSRTATVHGLALLGARRFAEALPHLRASVAADAEFAGPYNALISCCGHLGLREEAAA